MDPLKVLLVTYSFPPAGGVGVLRAASFARYFPAEGIRLEVLTARNASTVGADPALLREIPSEVTIHRTVTLDLPFGFKKGIKKLINGKRATAGKAGELALGKPNLFKRALADLLLPDPQVTWLPVLKRVARRIIRDRAIDLVLITVPPFSCLLMVEDLRRRFPELPIVVDFRDEWLATAFDLFLFSHSRRARRVAQRIEAGAIGNATTVVAVTEGQRQQIRARYPRQSEDKFILIPNGFEPGRLQHNVSPARRCGRIVASYVGTVYTLTNPTDLVEALLQLPPEVKSQFLLRFIGHIEEPRFRSALLQLGDMVELKGFMPHREALALMNETDYVLLINHDRQNVGGKFYDYIGSGKPILGAVDPRGDARQLIEELRVGWWADIHDIGAVRNLFLDASARGKPPFPDFKPDTAKIAQYERGALAKRYAALLHSIAASARENEPARRPAERVGKGS
jgi:glycosyltransferase involved in cell wall biosynthesis